MNDFRLFIDVGTGDSYYTAMAGGLLWTVCGIFVSYVLNSFDTVHKSMNVNVNYLEKKFKIDFYCIFRIRIVHIILL